MRSCSQLKVTRKRKDASIEGTPNIVIDLQPSVLQEYVQLLPLVHTLGDRRTQQAFGQYTRPLGF
ncbi:hypothetical protein ICC18_24665 [Paenibacillus sp. WST5]|uniref:Uncharacterized protein n=1 Tax=Paenibacillus sedimenti TaxID=2770274 RepID=A0A926KSI4_9BACL|nr:hypothetical protein [Paenibacillus sedimenti]